MELFSINFERLFLRKLRDFNLIWILSFNTFKQSRVSADQIKIIIGVIYDYLFFRTLNPLWLSRKIFTWRSILCTQAAVECTSGALIFICVRGKHLIRITNRWYWIERIIYKYNGPKIRYRKWFPRKVWFVCFRRQTNGFYRLRNVFLSVRRENL